MSLDYIKSVAKAVSAGAGAAIAYLIAIMPDEAVFSDVTTREWLNMVLVVLTVYGVTWAVPNTTVSEFVENGP